MLCKDRALRASVEELLAHPWLNQNPKGSGHSTSESPAAVTDGETAQAPVTATRQRSQEAAQYGIPSSVVSRLRNFSTMDAFAKESRKVLATFLPDEEVAALKNMFTEIDVDKNGVISMAELGRALQAKGVPDDKAKVSVPATKPRYVGILHDTCSIMLVTYPVLKPLAFPSVFT